jgi:sugar (pentulose or hexulose) kinase
MSGDDEEWLLGVDAGLTAVKAAVFSPDGTEAAVAGRETPADEPAPDHREVALPALWTAVAGTIREAVDESPAAPGDVAAVGVAGHGHGLYLLDAAGEPVRPGIRSTDSRASDLLAEWEREGTAAAVRERLGYEPFGADPLSLLAWLRRHEPASYDRIDRLLFCKDYLKYRLTGRICTDSMEASVFYDPDTESYDPGVFEELGLEGVTGALPEVIDSRAVCGEVTPAAAGTTGLPAGTPVASGLHDVGAVALGSGAHRPGQGVLIVGTWGQSIVVTDDPVPESTREPGGASDGDDGAPGDGAAASDGTPPGLARRYLDGWLRYKGNRSAAACLDWFVEEFGGPWRRQADEEDVSPYAVYDRVVEGTPVGAGGVLFHPYLQGSTDDPDATGGFVGLRTDHTRAHLLRAVYEGVAISQVERLAELEPRGGLADLSLGGGGARSEVWSQLFADVRDDSVAVPAGEEAGARGAAICAGLAAGTFADTDAAVARMVSTARRHDPDPEVAATYRRHRGTFEATLAALRPTWKRLSAGAETVDPDG